MRPQINAIYQYVSELAKQYNHKLMIIHPKRVMQELFQSNSYITPKNEIHFVNFQDKCYYIFHKDNNYWFDKQLFQVNNITNIKSRIKLFLQDSLSRKLYEKFECCICMNKVNHPLTCSICNVHICEKCKKKLIIYNQHKCPKCRNDFRSTEEYGVIRLL